MPSIINGLFAGRSGISSHGTAIAVIGDNISNASTVGYKASRAEFEDLVAGGQASGRVVGAGSSLSAINAVFQQGTLEFTSRPLDLAIDGNGFFAVAEGSQRFYTRAGNFKLDTSGYVVTQDGKAVLGFPAGGSGALEPLNVNTVSQSSVATTEVSISGNVNASAPIIASASIPDAPNPSENSTSTAVTYADLNNAATFSTVVQTFDSLGEKHTLTFFFFHTGSNQYTVKGYANAEEVQANGPVGYPREIGSRVMTFGGDGARTGATPPDMTLNGAAPFLFNWTNGASTSQTIDVNFSPFTQYSASSNILSITQDGQGIGTVTSINIDKSGTITALLDNGQSANIGSLGLVSFANPEGLTRLGGNLLQQSTDSGEPVVGRPRSGTFGAVQSGSLELSTVDIASEFVRLITLQRGFQANSRIITTINQLLNDIIQLA